MTSPRIMMARDDFPAPLLLISHSTGVGGMRDESQLVRDEFVRRLARHCHVRMPAAELRMEASAQHVDGLIGELAPAVLDAFPDAAVTDEAALHSDASRERFLTLLFALARLREVAQSEERAALVDFHARYKYTLLAYDEVGMRELGWIAASVADRPWPDTIMLYRARFARSFRSPAQVGAHINALTHAFGHLSDQLSGEERQFFLRQLDELRAGRLPLSGALALLRAWVLRFDVPYLAAQAYFRPYPPQLQ